MIEIEPVITTHDDAEWRVTAFGSTVCTCESRDAAETVAERESKRRNAPLELETRTGARVRKTTGTGVYNR